MRIHAHHTRHKEGRVRKEAAFLYLDRFSVAKGTDMKTKASLLLSGLLSIGLMSGCTSDQVLKVSDAESRSLECIQNLENADSLFSLNTYFDDPDQRNGIGQYKFLVTQRPEKFRSTQGQFTFAEKSVVLVVKN